MRFITLLSAAITGSTSELTVACSLYKELTQEVYNLEIPTTANDRKQLKEDREEVVKDLRKSLDNYKKNGKRTTQATDSKE